MKISSFCAVLALSTALTTVPARAQTAVEKLVPLPAVATATAPKMATVTPFITGLKEAQGMALDVEGTLLVCDYGAGEILKFSREGKALGKLATGLKGPAQIVLKKRRDSKVPATKNDIDFAAYVTERKANRVVEVNLDGKITPIGKDIAEPLGLVDGPSGLIVVSHTTSKVFRWLPPRQLINGLAGSRANSDPRSVENLLGRMMSEGRWEAIYSAPSTEGARYGFRWLAKSGGAYLLSDEVGERILMVTDSGHVATFATGISDPSGITIGPDNRAYVANEGDGGQLIRLNAEGEKTVVAEKLGRPRGILFLDDKTVLVSNRDGNVWKVVLP